jgi:transcriptional regulator with XRE-family HTH domain
MGKRSAQHVDVLVGNNIRSVRIQRGLSQNALGKLIDVSFQQIQKYESGANRVGAGRLAQIAEVLNVPVHALFGSGKNVSDRRPDHVPVERLVAQPDAMRLLRAFDRIAVGGVKVAAIHLIEAVGERNIKRDRASATRRRRRH